MASLRLRPAGVPQRPPAAWFLPGSEPAVWLRELSRWGRLPRGPCLYPVPRSSRDLRPQGLLVHATEEGAGDAPPSPRARAYGLEGRLFLPCEAHLEPPLAPDELAALAAGRWLLLHPAAGLVGFAPGEALALRDLLAVPPRREADWGRARPGPPPISPLREVVVEVPPTLQQALVGDAAIGSQSPQALPPAAGEARGPDPLGWLGRALARSARALAGGESEEPGEREPNWLDRLEAWAEQRRALRDLRQRELERLLRLLEENPDEGLRYALPLAGEGAPRGMAAPGESLGQRSLELDLTRPRGGRPADPWEVDAQLHHALTQSYREAARREEALGRHRRAAYIYLQLLGQPHAAAAVLERGRHHRDAARLYREHLGQTRDAARCLERGGLLAEAVPLYQELGEQERAGDLLCRLERMDEAEAAYRDAVVQLRFGGDLRAAARILETKLEDGEAALAQLASGWPGHPQAVGCLTDRFALLERLGRDEELVRLSEELGAGPPRGLEAPVAEVLAGLAQGHRRPGIRRRAADTTRALAGRCLSRVSPADARRLVQSVARLDPGDRLLARDVGRFLAERRRARPRVPAVRRREREPQWTGRIQLTGAVRWELAAAMPGGLVAAGRLSEDPRHVTCTRADWRGNLQYGHFLDAPPGELLLAAPTARLAPLLLAAAGGRIPAIRLPSSDAFAQPCSAGSPSWLPEGLLALCAGIGGQVYTVHRSRSDSLVLSGYDATAGGAPRFSRNLELLRLDALSPPVELLAATSQLLVSYGPRGELLSHSSVTGVRTRETTELLGPPAGRGCVSLGGSCFALPQEDGALVLRSENGSLQQTRFAAGLERPLVAASGDGRLVAADAGELRVYWIEREGPRHQQSLRGPGSGAIALLPTRAAHELAFVYADGRVHQFRLG